MNICPNCLRAHTDHTHDGYSAECEGCNVRGLSTSPRYIREHHYAKVLEADGKEACDAVKKRVSEEYRRIQRLKERSE